MIMHKYPDLLETKHLILRPVKAGDATDIFEYAGDEENTRFMIFNTHKSIDETVAFIDYITKLQNTVPHYALVLKENNKLIGCGGIMDVSNFPHCGAIGYILNKKYWGLGYTAEAMKAIIDYLFKNKLVHRIEACHFTENESSGRVMQKLGMIYEGTSKDKLFIRGKYITVKNYAIINNELS